MGVEDASVSEDDNLMAGGWGPGGLGAWLGEEEMVIGDWACSGYPNWTGEEMGVSSFPGELNTDTEQSSLKGECPSLWGRGFIVGSTTHSDSLFIGWEVCMMGERHSFRLLPWTPEGYCSTVSWSHGLGSVMDSWSHDLGSVMDSWSHGLGSVMDSWSHDLEHVSSNINVWSHDLSVGQTSTLGTCLASLVCAKGILRGEEGILRGEEAPQILATHPSSSSKSDALLSKRIGLLVRPRPSEGIGLLVRPHPSEGIGLLVGPRPSEVIGLWVRPHP